MIAALVIALGPPPVPLPSRWWRGQSRARIAAVIHTELSGAPVIRPTRHVRGYIMLSLGRGHPYADASGSTRLHRWLACRAAGRRLEAYEHAHHVGETSAITLDSTSYDAIEILHAVEHGHYHYDTHFTKDRLGRLVWLGAGRRMTEEEMNNAQQDE